MGAERRVAEGLAERVGGGSRLLASQVAVQLRDMAGESLGLHASRGLYVVFGVHAGSIAGTPSLNLPGRGQRERLSPLLGDLQQHAVDEEQQMLGKRRDVRELERPPRAGPERRPIAQVKQRLAQPQACE